MQIVVGLLVLLATSFIFGDVEGRAFPSYCTDIYNPMPDNLWRQLCGYGNPGSFGHRSGPLLEGGKDVAKSLLEELQDIQTAGDAEKKDGFFVPSEDYLDNMIRWLKINSYNRRY